MMDAKQLKHTIDFLSKVSFFSEVSPKSLENLSEDLTTSTHIPGEIIFKKDEIGDTMYVILNGKVKIHDGDHVYGYLRKGDCFGEYSLIDGETRSATVTVLERSEVVVIDRNRFINLMASDTGFSQGILSVMIRRHRDLDVIQERLAASKREVEFASSKMNGLIDGAMDAIIMFDQNFRIILTNPSANELLENSDTLQRNVLLFLGDESAQLIEGIVKEETRQQLNTFLPSVIKIIGSNDTETINEGTISNYRNEDEVFYTLILRNIQDRLHAQELIEQLTNQTQYLKEEIKDLTSNYGILAEDDSMLQVLKSIEQVAGTDATVLINGETGTGKELVASAIHMESKRQDKPLIRINCGAIPANLIESELFGHEKGAFTGASTSRKGRFLLADKGTIFLDEIGELPIELQPKLLRVIQEGEFDPLGSSETIKVDVRIIAATNRDLLSYSKEGHFREDLYYRLNVFPIQVPALRDRGEDVSLIAQEMLLRFASKLNKSKISLSEADKQLLNSYDWPGNVRELQNLVERAVIVSQSGAIDWNTILPLSAKSSVTNVNTANEKILNSKELVIFERDNILKALRKTKWKISGRNGAASLLQMAPTTLASKIKAHGIERPV